MLKLTRLSPVLALALLGALAGCVSTESSDPEDDNAASNENVGEGAQSALYTAPGSCTYDGTTCFKWEIYFSDTGGAGCVTDVYLDVKKNGESWWTNVKHSTPADPGFIKTGREISGYTAQSIHAIRYRRMGPPNCAISYSATSPWMKKSGTNLTKVAYAVRNPSYPGSGPTACNVTGVAILNSTVFPDLGGNQVPLVPVDPPMSLFTDRTGYLGTYSGGQCYYAGDNFQSYQMGSTGEAVEIIRGFNL